MPESKEPDREPFTDFKFRPLTLREREICSNKVMEFKDFFTQILIWIRYGLTELKGVEITKENFDEEVNNLGNEDMADISLAIRMATEFPGKKKSS